MKKNNKQKIYIILGCFFTIAIFLLVMLAFPKSYALEGFGEMNLTCDKTIGVGEETINCEITGTVATTSYVSSLSSQIKLSENLEFVSFTTDSNMWLGNGDDGNIQLYTGENKSSNFTIGSFSVKIKDGVTNTTETIKLEENYFYDDNFEEQTIKNVSVDIKTPQYYSETYQITEDYIITNTKDIATIIANIQTENCSLSVEKDSQLVTTGVINEGAKLKVINNEKVLKELAIIYINSEKYDLTKGYILESIEDTTQIANHIEALNGTLSVKNGQLVLSYNNTGILSYDIINLTSSKYNIYLSKDSILIDEEISDSILENISKTDNIQLARNDNKINIIYQEKVIKTLDIINILSNEYEIKLVEGYIYIGNIAITNNIIEKISSNENLSINENQLIISKNTEKLASLDIINIQTDTYKINTSNQYIYTKNTNQLEKLKEKITVTNGSISVESNILKLMYKEKCIKEFTLYYFTSEENKISDDTIYIHGDMEYNEFIQAISLNGLSYHIYNTSNTEITSGMITDDYMIKLYVEDVLVDNYHIKTEYLDFKDGLTIEEDKKIIYDIQLGTTYNDIINNIDTSGTIEIQDKNGNKLTAENKVKTYSIITIKLSSETYQYQIAVLGDVTGTGTITAGDIAKLYQNVKGKNTFDNVSILAGDIQKDGKIRVNDVAKAYSYLKGKISTLE